MANKKPKKQNGFNAADKEDAAIRKKNHKLAKRDKEGKLICPKRFCEGYRDIDEIFGLDK